MPRAECAGAHFLCWIKPALRPLCRLEFVSCSSLISAKNRINSVLQVYDLQRSFGRLFKAAPLNAMESSDYPPYLFA